MCSLASQSFPTHGGGSEQGLNAVLRVPGMMQCLWALPSCSPVALSHQGRMAEPRPAAELPGFIPFPPLTCSITPCLSGFATVCPQRREEPQAPPLCRALQISTRTECFLVANICCTAVIWP